MKNYKLNKLYFFLFLPLLSAFLLTSCNLEQEVEIDLPEYDSRPVLECYLEAGKPFNLLISRSAPYFAPFPSLDQEFLQDLLIDSAEVVIRHNGEEYVLENQIRFNPNTGKFSNYFNPGPVPFDTINPFELSVTFNDGSTITGSTRMLPVIPLDSLVIEPAESDTLARVLTYFTDRVGQENFYRRTFHESSLDSLPEQDFPVNDRIVEDVVVFGTGFNYAKGDTIISTLYHIEESYYTFLTSVDAAAAGNGNPFAQPSPVATILGGTANAIGIFTGLSYDRVTVILGW